MTTKQDQYVVSLLSCQVLLALDDYIDCRVLERIHSVMQQPSLADAPRTERARERLLAELDRLVKS